MKLLHAWKVKISSSLYRYFGTYAAARDYCRKNYLDTRLIEPD